jgi:carboxymethylenebutenolidase
MATQREHVSISVGGGAMNAFLCRPEGEGQLPAVIEIHEIFGLTAHHEDVTCRLAEEGYVSLAPDLFWTIGAPPAMSDRESFMRFRQSMDDRQFLQSLDAALDWLRSQPYVDGDHVAIVGFCMGGYYALLEAIKNPSFTACVDFYGAPLENTEKSETRPWSLMEELPDLKVPYMGLFGDEDQSIPVEQVRRLEALLATLDVPSEVVLYPGAGHAFFNDTSEERYRRNAALDAWAKMIQFFDRYQH